MSTDVSTLSRSDRLRELMQRINSALSVDFCPGANRWVYWLKNPLWLLVLAVVGTTLCGLLVNPWVFVLSGLLLTLTLMGVALPSLAMRGIECCVLFDVPRTEVGKPAMVRLQVRNRWPLPVWGLSLIHGFASRTDRDTSDSDEGVALARVGGWSTVEFSWPFCPHHRGLYPRGTAEVETSFPFGLFHARKAARVSGQLTVWPETVALTGMPPAVESRQLTEHFSDRRVGDFGDVLGTRPFRQGDSLRRVHWAQTARQQTLIVTERQAPTTSSVRILLDLRSSSHPSGNDQALEQCVTVAASLCRLLHECHLRTELSCGRTELVASDRPGDFTRLMDHLAVADRDSSGSELRDRSDAGFQVVITTPAGCQPQRPWQIVVASDEDSSASIPGAWLVVRNSHDLREQFPLRWQQEVRHA